MCAFAALLAVAVLAPYAIALVRVVSGTSAWLGFRPDYDGVVHVVASGSPAALAGIVPGDRIDLAATPIGMRRFAVAQLDASLPLGTPIVLAVRHAGAVRNVTLHAAAKPILPAFTAFIEVAQWFGEAAGIAVAFVILARRPGFLTWMLYLYALSVPAATDQVAFGGLSLFAYLALTLSISDVIGGFGPAALLVFALRFPDDHVEAEHRWAQTSALLLGGVLCILWLAPDLLTTVGRGANAFQAAYPIVGGIAVVATAAALFARLGQTTGDLRSRMHWLIVAILLLPVVRRVAFFIGAVAPATWVAVAQPLQLAWLVAEILGWIAIAYAVLRYRTVSVSFVIDRALVYGALTALLVTTFAIAEWLVAKVFEQAELLPAVSLGLALLFGFWFHGLETRLEGLIERVFFAARHRAERRIERSMGMIAFASRVGAIGDLLVAEPVEVLDIASAALFLRGSDQHYRRVAARGWPDAAAASLDDQDPLVLALRDGLTPQPLADLRASPAPFPSGLGRPSIVIPIVVRRALLGIVFYAAHTDGRSLDPDSVAALQRLGAAAGPALVHLMLRRSQRTERRLREELHDSHAELAALREDVTWLRTCLEKVTAPNGALIDGDG